MRALDFSARAVEETEEGGMGGYRWPRLRVVSAAGGICFFNSLVLNDKKAEQATFLMHENTEERIRVVGDTGQPPHTHTAHKWRGSYHCGQDVETILTAPLLFCL